MSQPGSIPLAVLFARSLLKAIRSYNLPTIHNEAQELIRSGLTDLQQLNQLISKLSLFSPNETLEDISTRHLVFLFVPYVTAELQNRSKASDRTRRGTLISKVLNSYEQYVRYLDLYEIAAQGDRQSASGDASILDPAKRREWKIQQYLKEKDMKESIQAIQKRRGSTGEDLGSSDYELILSLLPPSAKKAARTSPSDDSPTLITATHEENDDEKNDQVDEVLRELTILALRMMYVQTLSNIQSLLQEQELLKNAPPEPEIPPTYDQDERKKAQKKQDDIWKLDAPRLTGGPDGRGPLLNPQGKPLRAFTILPSETPGRAQLQQEVFRPSYNLPTMTIDEYLDIEQQRGNFISGGGTASMAEPTSKEKLALEAEMDGTIEGEEKAEIKRRQDEKWARYTDENPRGAGNTMNRG